MNATPRVARIVSCLALAVLFACGSPERAATTTGTATGTAPASTADSRPVSVKGSDTMVILTQRLAEEYMKANRGTVIQVNGGGSGTGIAALINGTTDIAQASRPMSDDEKSKAKASRGSDVVEVPIALDSLAVFVHQSNSVKAMTIEQIAGIFKGTTTNWKQIGGPDAPIVLYGRESSSGTYDYFREHVLKKADFSPRVQTLQGTAAIINAVARDRNGIGYGGIAYAKEVRAVAINTGGSSVAPSETTVADGSYPLARKLFFYHLANAPERSTNFVKWTLTPEAQGLVNGVGYFPLTR